MPINAPPEYYKAEEKYRAAKTREEKIAALEEMIRALPKHKGTENLLAQLKSRLAKLREQRPKKGRSRGIKKEGDVLVSIVGYPNSGKSRLLKRLTGADVEVSEVPYSTSEPVVGVADYGGAKIQFVEIPAFFRPDHIGIVRNSDAVLVVSLSEQDARKLLESIRCEDKPFCIAEPDEDCEKIKERIWSCLGLIRVYTRNKGKVERRPVVLKKGSTVRDLVEEIHSEMLESFRFARVWPGKYPGERVGLGYRLRDGEIVEIYA
ncbi:MAG: TGS domain-containing protein [Candidatus Micrarchaeota archaeon]|nr:TGS domain-containing protein [Candidatus Micrarchaeota archaeon]